MGAIRYRLTIKDNHRVCVCGKCSNILPGWPEKYKNGLPLGAWAVMEQKVLLDALKASCPLEKIQLEMVQG